jgi:hypothetical protein
MNEIKSETSTPVQSKKMLIKASVSAFLIAVFIFICIILPAEYNVDPMRTGALLGLTVLAETNLVENGLAENSTEQKEPISNDVKAADEKQNKYQLQKNEESVLVPANRGVEYKFQMQKYSNLTYEWTAQGKILHFDFHGEPAGDTTGYFESYTIADAYEMKGSMTVPFDGVHGWYWKNETEQDVVVTLKTQGHYKVIGLIH